MSPTQLISEEELKGVDGGSIVVGIATAVIAATAVAVGIAVITEKKKH